MSITLRIILGDQLNENHSWYKNDNKNIVYAMFEMKQETNYVKHHIQKIIGFFLAMRNFYEMLKEKGFHVEYFKISDANNTHSLEKNLELLIEKFQITKIEYQYPDEFRLDKQFQDILTKLKLPAKVYDTEHFFTTRNELEDFSKDRKQTVMEDFYRYMRIKHQILVEKDEPIGGKWNYDSSNRKKWSEDKPIPKTNYFENKCEDILNEIKESEIVTFGKELTSFPYPISRKQAQKQLSFFCDNLLVHFGDYQDAMHEAYHFLFHSNLSFALNLKIISPKEVVAKIEAAFYENSTIDISQAEGFIRQVIGWREYIRGVYWQTGEGLKRKNFFDNKASLPSFYWNGNTKMNCVKQSLQNSLQNSYAHHIQRLMVLGNLVLLLGVDPDKVDAWYLGVYVDAVEWVQLPNTRGMSQYADGGKVATKPYVSSANYINKMSNYCDNCCYNHKTKIESDSCPFNSLYWKFLHSNKEKLKHNHRMRLMYSLLDKQEKDKENFSKIIAKAASIIKNIDKY